MLHDDSENFSEELILLSRIDLGKGLGDELALIISLNENRCISGLWTLESTASCVSSYLLVSAAVSHYCLITVGWLVDIR